MLILTVVTVDKDCYSRCENPHSTHSNKMLDVFLVMHSCVQLQHKNLVFFSSNTKPEHGGHHSLCPYKEWRELQSSTQSDRKFTFQYLIIQSDRLHKKRDLWKPCPLVSAVSKKKFDNNLMWDQVVFLTPDVLPVNISISMWYFDKFVSNLVSLSS